MKTIERRLSRYENTISKESRKSQAGIGFNTDKPGKFDSVHMSLDPAKGGHLVQYAPDIETAMRKLEAMTRDFVNPVWVLFYEESAALEDQRIAWYNSGGNVHNAESLLTMPVGQLWSEILHRGKWIKENERKQEA
jgi:hypothetical protein